MLKSLGGHFGREAQIEGHKTVGRMLIEQILKHRLRVGEDILSSLVNLPVDGRVLAAK